MSKAFGEPASRSILSHLLQGFGEQPHRSILTHLQGLDFPVTREELAEAAGYNEAPAEVINFFKSLPDAAYASLSDLERDFSEAARRFAVGPNRRLWFEQDRSNLGRDAVEDAPPGKVRHP